MRYFRESLQLKVSHARAVLSSQISNEMDSIIDSCLMPDAGIVVPYRNVIQHNDRNIIQVF